MNVIQWLKNIQSFLVEKYKKLMGRFCNFLARMKVRRRSLEFRIRNSHLQHKFVVYDFECNPSVAVSLYL